MPAEMVSQASQTRRRLGRPRIDASVRITLTGEMRTNWLDGNPSNWRHAGSPQARIFGLRQCGREISAAIGEGDQDAIRRSVRTLRSAHGASAQAYRILQQHLPGSCFCPRCSSVENEEDMVTVDSDQVCPSCSSEANTCSRCGCLSFDRMTRTADTGDSYCRECRSSRCYRWQDGQWRTTREPVSQTNRTIGSYSSSRCERLAGGTSELPDTGFELEWIPRNEGEATDVARQIFVRAGEYLGGIERDGSIGSWDGAECVTHYGPLDKILEAAGSICSVLKSKRCLSHKTPSGCNCGLHVAIGRTWYENGRLVCADGYAISKFVVFWNHPQNRDFLKAFTRRWGCGYCQPKPDKAVSPEDAANQSKLIVNQDRYELVNLQNSNRIEVRAFRGTTNAKTLRACVSLTVWLWRYCSRPEVSGDDLTSAKFIEWARTASVTDSDGVVFTANDIFNYYDGRANK